MKKIVSLVLVAVLALTAIGGTLAYFTDKDEATNTFTVGNVDIILTEPEWVASGSQEAPEVYPGEALKKDPTVTNNGKNPCFVRVSVTGLDCLGSVKAGDIVYRNANYEVGKLNENWVEYEGYFYYTKVLPIYDGETNNHVTTPVFSSIVIPTDLTNGNGTDEFNVGVFAQAVQAQGAKPSWSAVQDMTVEEIAAWFKTCGL